MSGPGWAVPPNMVEIFHSIERTEAARSGLKAASNRVGHFSAVETLLGSNAASQDGFKHTNFLVGNGFGEPIMECWISVTAQERGSGVEVDGPIKADHVITVRVLTRHAIAQSPPNEVASETSGLMGEPRFALAYEKHWFAAWLMESELLA